MLWFFMNEVINGEPQISFVTHIELLCFKTTEYHQKILKDFVDDALVHYPQLAITEKTILIRSNAAVKVPDALIAATAIHHKLTLLTRNTKDFDKIPDFKVLNPHLL